MEATKLKLAMSEYQIEKEEIVFAAKSIEYMKRNGLEDQVFRNRLGEHLLLIKTERISYDIIDLGELSKEEGIIAISENLALSYSEETDDYLVLRNSGKKPLVHYSAEIMDIVDL